MLRWLLRRVKPKEAGEWVKLHWSKPNSIACCDCGLVHQFSFKITDGQLFICAWRDEGQTEWLRKRQPFIKK